MGIHLRIFLGILFTILMGPNVRADDLPRHGVIGVTVAPPDASRPEDSRTNPPTVKTVVPGSAADSAGIQIGDNLVGVPRQKAIGVNLERHTLTPERECYPTASAARRELAESMIRFGSDALLHLSGLYGQDAKKLKNSRVSGGPWVKQRDARSDEGALRLGETPRPLPGLAPAPFAKEELPC